MNYSEYLKSWKGSLAENKYSRYIILTMAIANLVLVMVALSKDQTVVLVPPELTRESKVASKQADAGYKEAWATHVAMMLGNVTPRTAKYVSEQVGKLMGPRVYRQMMDGITEQAKRIEDDQLTIQFAPNTAFYLPEKDVVVVTGEYTLRGMQDSEERMLRTYEIGIDVNNYAVRVDSMEVYEGAWTPQREEAKKVEAKKARQEERQAKRSS
jgi:conjugal transfer pilus assembly protein TraE